MHVRRGGGKLSAALFLMRFQTNQQPICTLTSNNCLRQTRMITSKKQTFVFVVFVGPFMFWPRPENCFYENKHTRVPVGNNDVCE